MIFIGSLPLLILATSQTSRSCENATIATPRTLECSAKNLSLLERWQRFQRTLAADAAAYRSNGRPSLLLMGDSITESWRGTSIGQVSERTLPINGSLAETSLGRDYPSPLILAISGDETQHLLWRLKSELSPAVCADSHLSIVLLIGTNNLGNAQHNAEATAAGVVAVARALLSRTRGRLLVHALLPRGEGPKKRSKRRAAGPSAPPYTSLMPRVRHTNTLIAAAADGSLTKQFPGRVRRVDCGGLFLARAGDLAPKGGAGELAEVRADLMPDELHPNLQGMKMLAGCVRQALVDWNGANQAHDQL